MKLLIYCDDPGMGGVGHHCVAVARAALRCGWEVVFAQTKMEHPTLKELEALGVRFVWLGYDTSQHFQRTITDAQEPSRVFQVASPSLVLFADCCHASNIAAKHVAITRGIPFIVVCHSAATYIAQRFASCMPIVRAQFARAVEIVAVSQMALEVTRTHYGLNRQRGIVIHSGRPPRFFAPRSSEERSRVRGELGIPDSATVCLTTARLVDDKGYGIQYAAIDELRREKKLDGLYFVWAGNGPLLPQLQAAIPAQGFAGVIHCLGHRSSVHELYDAADVFVLPTFHESFGLSVAEAMAKGLAVIASKVEGIPEVMGETGIYLPDPTKEPAEAIKVLKKSILMLHRDSGLMAKMGAEGRERAQALFTEERMLSQFAEVLTRVGALTETRTISASPAVPALQTS